MKEELYVLLMFDNIATEDCDAYVDMNSAKTIEWNAMALKFGLSYTFGPCMACSLVLNLVKRTSQVTYRSRLAARTVRDV